MAKWQEPSTNGSPGDMVGGFIAFSPRPDWGRRWQSTAPVVVVSQGEMAFRSGDRWVEWVEFRGNRGVMRVMTDYEPNRI